MSFWTVTISWTGKVLTAKPKTAKKNAHNKWEVHQNRHKLTVGKGKNAQNTLKPKPAVAGSLVRTAHVSVLITVHIGAVH